MARKPGTNLLNQSVLLSLLEHSIARALVLFHFNVFEALRQRIPHTAFRLSEDQGEVHDLICVDMALTLNVYNNLQELQGLPRVCK